MTGVAVFQFNAGAQFETLTKPELEQALRAQYAWELQEAVRGIKPGEIFLNLAQIQQVALQPAGSAASVNVLNLPGTVGYTPGNGFMWAVMNVGWELTGASNIRIYKGAPPGLTAAPAGIGRLAFSNTGTPAGAAATFSKGQLMMRSGEQLTFVTVTNTIFFLSLYVAYIQVPAERVGELLL